MTAIEDSDVLEVSTPELDDVVRLEDRYGRTTRPGLRLGQAASWSIRALHGRLDSGRACRGLD